MVKCTKFTLFLIALFFVNLSFAQRTIIHCGKLIDGKRSKAQDKMTIVVDGDKIVEVRSGFMKPGESDQLLDLSGKTVLPGLMDMHVHVESQTSPNSYIQRFTLNDADVAYRAAKYANITLMSGFTTVRDLGGSGVNISLRDAINNGYAVGPRIYTSGKSIATTGGHADPTNGYRKELSGDPGPKEGVANGPFDARKAVRQRYKNGSDLIKITATAGVLSMAKNGSAPQFMEDELRGIIETANDMGMTVAAHAHGAEGMKRAIRAGVTSIEHGTFMDEETIALMKQHGTWYVPTLLAGKTVADSAKVPGYYPEIVVPKALAIGPQLQDTFSRAYKKGVKIAFGTDAGVFVHGYNAREFNLMVEGGMSEMEAIQAATVNAAMLLGIEDELGSVEKGKKADIIAVEGDPLKDISVLQQVEFVMKGGEVFKNI
ncbi:metal-dependent hydrolase family protein [Xanthovirga aplysinae]|uniref:metal-dependent hydrolase family protein n=1 Tax=Xanthovirga aplysinae TaxID=2529853 RepID=UPI0012BD2707|nr:amidohydrolase family protein [Xanthovirga aplysinae]MTI32039.1 amidohydrolase family protein [Xanthovirga aplysinae]